MNSHDAYITAREFFRSGKTRPVLYRKKQLYALLKGIDGFRGVIDGALKADLNKSSREAFLTEIYLVKDEIRHMIRHMNRYGRTSHPLPGAAQLPGRLSIRREPYGAVLIISPWNYPFQLSLLPVVGAIAAGIEEKVREVLGEKVWRIEGQQNAVWIAMDYVDVVVHIFQTELRGFYRLEELWADAPMTKYEYEE